MIGGRRTRFAIGFVTGAVTALAANLFPYWQSYGAGATDGYTVIGFPLTFRRVGGFSPISEFRVDLLFVDVAVGLVFALILGMAALKLSPRFLRRSGRGFPVATESDRDSAAPS